MTDQDIFNSVLTHVRTNGIKGRMPVVFMKEQSTPLTKQLFTAYIIAVLHTGQCRWEQYMSWIAQDHKLVYTEL